MKEWSKTSKKNSCTLLQIRCMRWQYPQSSAALMLLILGMPVCKLTTHLEPYQSLETLYTSQARPAMVCFQETCWGPQKCIHQKHTEHIFSSQCVYILQGSPQQVSFNLCVHPGCELPFSDSFALLFKISSCSVLVSVLLEDELEATFPSSSSSPSLLVFKVAKFILGASLAQKVAIHNC